MSVLAKLSEFEADYETMFGEKPDSNLSNFMIQVEKMCEKFERRGREDAMNGVAASCKATFIEGWNKACRGEDPEMAEVMGGLLWLSYMDGYGSVGEVVCLEGEATP